MSSLIRKTTKASLFFSLLLAATHSHALGTLVNLDPYFGFDAQIRHITWQSNLGDNLFKKNYPQGKVFGGFRFCDYIGLEAGYEATVPRTAKNVLSNGSLILGQPITATAPVMTEGKFEISGWYGALVGALPLTNCDALFASIGWANLKATHWATQLASSDASLNQYTFLRRFSDKKGVLRVGGGGEHMFWDCVGVRAILEWENTARFKNLFSNNVPERVAKAGLKNSWNYGLGIFTKF